MPLLLTSGIVLADPSQDMFMGLLLLVFFAAGAIWITRFLKHVIMTLLGATEAKMIEFGNEKIDGGEYKRRELFELIREEASSEQIKEKEEEIKQMFVDRKSKAPLAFAVFLADPLGSCISIVICFFCMNWLVLAQIIGLDRIWVALLFIVVYMSFRKVSADLETSDRKVFIASEKLK